MLTKLRDVLAVLLVAQLAHGQSTPPPSGYNLVQEEGSALARRKTLNLVGATVTCADDVANARTTCTITASGHTIEDEGSALTARTSLNFVGANVTCADSGGKTVCTITGASPGGSTGQAQYNNAGAFGGSADLTFTAGLITINAAGASNAQLNSNTSLFVGTGGVGAIAVRTENTPDAPLLLTNTSGSWHLREQSDGSQSANNGPCGSVLCTDPTLIAQGHSINTTEYRGFAYYGSAGRAITPLVAGAPTTVMQIPVAAAAGTGGRFIYTVFASDATDHQARSGMVSFVMVNKAGTETCKVYGSDSASTENPNETQDGSGAGALSSSTLTYTWGASNSPTNGCNFTLNAVSGLTENVLALYHGLYLSGPGEPLPQ